MPPSVYPKLVAPHFFASVVAPGFGSSISVAFLLASGLTAGAAVISAFRGVPFIYGAARAGLEPVVPEVASRGTSATESLTTAVSPSGGATGLGKHH